MPGVYSKSWLIRAVGGATAYVFAIQIVLAVSLASQMAVDHGDAHAICHSLGLDGATRKQDEPSNRPDRHALCGICTIAAYVPILYEAPSGLMVWPRQFAVRVTEFDGPAFSIRRHEPRSSQGPPLAV